MYKKGHTPHNKGDDRVNMHYRDKPKAPKKRPAKSYETATPWDQSAYYNQLGTNFLKRWFS